MKTAGPHDPSIELLLASVQLEIKRARWKKTLVAKKVMVKAMLDRRGG